MTETEKQNRRNECQILMAVKIVEDVIHEVNVGRPADVAVMEIFKKHSEFGSRDRRFYAHTLFCYFRWLGWIRLLAPGDLRLMCGWAVIIDPSSTEPSTTIWRQALQLSDEQWRELSNTDLHEKGRLLAEWFGLPRFSIGSLVPEWLSRINLTEQKQDDFISACQKRPSTWLRISENDIDRFLTMLDAQQLQHYVNGNIRGAVAITSPFQLQLVERAWGHSIQVQDLASQAVGMVCHAASGETWWDMCCGAGGKTLQLAEAVGQHGHITATDVRDSILKNLKRRALSHGLFNITEHPMDAAKFPAVNPPFDGVLIDAPCSGIGTWPRNPDARWRTTFEMVTEKTLVQRELLDRASQALKLDGHLVYSVCTLSEQEGPAMIRDFLNRMPQFSYASFSHPLTSEPTTGEITIMPGDGPCDGMYIARLRRMDRAKSK